MTQAVQQRPAPAIAPGPADDAWLAELGAFHISEDIKAEGLYNADLAPTPPGERTWGTWNFAALWVGMVVCIPTYMIASSMIANGMSWTQAIFTVLLGNIIVLVPMVLNGVAGAKHGLSFPVLIRSSFGTIGTHVPSLMRALVACGWFGIQTAIGGAAIYQMVEAIWPGTLSALAPMLPAWVGLGTGQAICFAAFWVINVYFIVAGTESIKWLETLAAPFLLLMGFALLGWAWHVGGGFDRILVADGKLASWSEFAPVFWPSLTGMVGFWATLSLNIPDFTRYARNQRAQLVGQALGLPLPMALFAFIGVAVTGATMVVFGEAIWNPIDLIGKFGSTIVVAGSLFVLAIATLTTNIAANVVAPANSFANLAPRWISLRTGGVIAALVGTAILPWKLLADPSQYVFTWLIGYSALLGPIAGIMIADYFVVRRGDLKLDQLYSHRGEYGRVNWRALLTLVLAIVPCVPGFLVAIAYNGWDRAGFVATATWLPSAGTWVDLYPYAWFVGFAIAFVLYAAIARTTATRSVTS